MRERLYRQLLPLTVLAVCLMAVLVQAAYLRNVPQEVRQPDGKLLRCLASGDEYFNWLHDADGFVIIQDPESGYYVYADKQGGALVPTSYVAGTVDPASLGLEKELRPSAEWLTENARNALGRPDGYQGDMVASPTTGTINNIAVFIRFSDEAEFTDNYDTIYDAGFNNTSAGAVSMKSYFLATSYNTLTIQTYAYPNRSGSTVVSYQDSQPRAYYQPYNAVTNPIGYQGGDNGTERRDREHTLLKNAVNAVASQVPPALVVDGDNDGYVDNVCFIVKGSPDGWASLLWPHRWSLYSQTAYINGKRVYDYNLQLQTWFDVGVLCHEMFHSLGSPDLYHYYYGTNLAPVSSWDIMESQTNPPQHMGAYMKFRYGHWIASIPQITTSGTYTLNPVTASTNNCYKIASPNSSTEFFVVEYRKRATSGIESAIPGSGLVVYRINSTFDGNGNASYNPPSVGDEVYIYRPGGVLTPVPLNGTPSTAHFSSDVGRTSINDTTDPTSWLWNSGAGGPGGLSLSNVTSAGSTISFSVCNLGALPAPTGVSATGTCTGVTVSWSASPGATGYNVLRGSVCGTVQAAFNGVTSPYTDTTAVPGTTYQYWVVALSTCGASANSGCAAASRLGGAPASPTGVTAAGSCTGVSVSWSASAGATSYNVLRGSVCGTAQATFSGVTSPYTDTTGVAGVSYQYWVVAVNACGTSPNSSCSTGLRTTVPSSPTGMTATTDRCTDVQVAWNAVSGATSYNVLRGTSCGNVLTTFTGVTSPYNDTTAVVGLSYQYWVVAVNACGASPNSPCATGTRLAAPAAPAAPTFTSVTWNSLTVNWAATPDALSYDVWRATGASCAGAAKITAASVTGTSYDDTGLLPSTQYSYYVVANNACGTSASGACATSTTSACTAAAITVQPQSQTVISGQTATLNVTATGTAPLNYQWYQGASGNTSTPVGTNSNGFTTPALAATTSYWVRVSNGCGIPADSITATVTVCTPPAITVQPQSTTIPTGTTTTLTVAAAGTAPLTYQWYQGASGITSTPVGSNSSSFTTPALTATTSYWARVSNGCGTPADSVTATVTLCTPAAITAQPQSITIPTGTATTLTVSAAGSPTLSYQWYQGGNGDTSHPVGGDSPSFATPPLTETTTYWARVSNGCGAPADSAAATVTVCTSPSITGQPQGQTIPLGHTVTLSVTASGTAPMSYQWYMGSAPDTSTPVGTNAGSYTSPALVSDSHYWVRVSNGCGTVDSSTATVTVIQRPVINSFTAAPSSIMAGQSATLSWDVAGATSLSLSQGIGDVTGTSQRVVSPPTTTGYTLTATNLSGSVTASVEVTVCSFSCDAVVPLRGTAGLAVPFTGSGTIGGGCAVPVTYDWNFGDGSAHGTTSAPTHTYTSPNTYGWTLTVNAGGVVCAKSGSITVVNPPVLTRIKKVAPPFRIVVTGSNLQNGIQVTINGAPWPNVLWKTPGKVKIQGGAALKSAVPKGVPVTLKFMNPDGGEVTTIWSY